MKLQEMIRRCLKANPEVADIDMQDGCAILFNDENGMVYSLKTDMTEERFKALCKAVCETDNPRMIAARLA